MPTNPVVHPAVRRLQMRGGDLARYRRPGAWNLKEAACSATSHERSEFPDGNYPIRGFRPNYDLQYVMVASKGGAQVPFVPLYERL